MMRGSCLAVAAISATLITGCTLEPTYHRPALPVQGAWPNGPAADAAAAQASQSPAGQSTAAAAADIGWRQFFTDPMLQNLIELALKHSPDARIAALNVLAAQDQYRVQRASLFPKISASGVEQVEKFPAGVAAIASGGGAAAGGTAGAVDTAGSGVFRYFNVGVGITSYEVDFFGRLRSLNHQKLEQYLSYAETRRSTVISLVSEVANAYLSLLADQELLRITQQTLESQQGSLDLVKQSFEGGVSTALDLNQAQTTVASARASLAQYTRQVAQDRNALTLLIGTTLPSEPSADGALDDEKILAELPAGLPSDLLTRRPDILAAEHNLIAANAQIGAARAAFFPSVTLTGTYGTASTQLSGLFDHGSTAWTFSPQISLPIFAGGANVASLDLAKVQKNVYIAQYEKAIQTAFREVADALAGRGTLDDQLAADRELVEANQQSYQLSDMRFRSGVDNYLNVLVSQRSLFTAQQQLVGVKLSRLQNLVTLYKTLGGGWLESSSSTP